jgi:hypothetical protein
MFLRFHIGARFIIVQTYLEILKTMSFDIPWIEKLYFWNVVCPSLDPERMDEFYTHSVFKREPG